MLSRLKKCVFKYELNQFRLLGFEAYFIRDWFTLQIVAHAQLLILFGIWFLVPESPRWLLAKGKVDRAIAIITKGAEINKTNVDKEILNNLSTDASDTEDVDNGKNTQLSAKDLFRPCLIFNRLLNMCYQWFSVELCYYGLTFASVSLLGDPYTNFLLSVATEIPGTWLIPPPSLNT